MARPRSNAYTVGLVAAVGMGVIALAITLVGREQKLWEGRDDYRIHFTRTNGLAEGAPVRLDGVNVGSVARMRFPSDPAARYVEVRLSISSEVRDRINQNTLGRIQSLGLLGDKYIELTSTLAEADPAPVQPGDLIRSVDPVDYEALLGQSGDVVSNAIEVTALLRQVLTDINNRSGLIGRLISDNQLGTNILAEIDSTVNNLESATARMDELLARVEAGHGALGVLMEDSTGVQARESLANLRTATVQANEFLHNLNHGAGMVPRLVNDAEFAEETITQIERSATSIAEITTKVRAGQGTLGKLVYDDSLYDNANEFVGGSGSGGFWKLLWRGVKFFLPPWPASDVEPVQPDPITPD